MSAWIELAGSLLIFLGSFFLFSAGLGLLRMPDAFTRIQAGTKATTLGAVLVLCGLGLLEPGWIMRLGLFVFFVFSSNPISSHALARAAERIGTPMVDGTRIEAPQPVAASPEEPSA